MTQQDAHEPAYPTTAEECEAYTGRLVDALRRHLGDRLVCVLLSGSWARGEARPGSDIDLTVVVDTVDDEALDRLREAWGEARTGYANVYGLDEIPTMSREAIEMYTVNARALFGANPFEPPTAEDFRRDLATNAEVVARMARHLFYAFWMTPEEIGENLDYLLGKACLKRALQNLVALRTGRFPGRREETRERLVGSAEGELLAWLDGLDEDRRVEESRRIAGRLSGLARAWFLEIARSGRPRRGPDGARER
jgi:hypothetical protein